MESSAAASDRLPVRRGVYLPGRRKAERILVLRFEIWDSDREDKDMRNISIISETLGF